MSEHPFAAYIRILGKGPRLSRPLTQEEARVAGGMLIRGEVTPEQIGAFFCLLRLRTETPAELAGLAQALRDHLPPLPRLAVDIDWPSYAGKARRAPLFLLTALLLAESGQRVVMHGASGHTAGRLYSDEALSALGIAVCANFDAAERALDAGGFAFLPMALFHDNLAPLFGLKRVLGLRSPLHSVIRHLNPFDAPTSLISVFHPNYRAVHREAGQLLGQANLACFKGDGGEIERRPDKPCLVEGLRDGAAFAEEWQAWDLPAGEESELSPAFLRGLWRGDIHDERANAIVIATSAVILRQTGQAKSQDEARTLADDLWQRRGRARISA